MFIVVTEIDVYSLDAWIHLNTWVTVEEFVNGYALFCSLQNVTNAYNQNRYYLKGFLFIRYYFSFYRFME